MGFFLVACSFYHLPIRDALSVARLLYSRSWSGGTRNVESAYHPSSIMSYIFPGVFLSSRVTGACPVTTDLIMRVNVRTTTTTMYTYIPFPSLSGFFYFSFSIASSLSYACVLIALASWFLVCFRHAPPAGELPYSHTTCNTLLLTIFACTRVWARNFVSSSRSAVWLALSQPYLATCR